MKKNILEAFELFKKIRFPLDSSDDVVSEVHAELAEYDGYMAGLILSFGNGNTENKNKIVYDDSLEQRLVKRLEEKPKLKEEIEIYLNYLNKIKELVEMVNNS